MALNGKNLIVAFDTAALATVRLLLPAVPRGMARFAGSVFGAMGYVVSPERRRRSLDNLRKIFPEKPDKKLRRISRDCFLQSGAGFAEVFHMRHKKKDDLLRIVSLEGVGKIEKALSGNKGVIIAGGHLSAFPLGMLALASLGFPVAALVRQADNVRVEEMSDSIRRQFGLDTIHVKPRHEATRKCLGWLRSGRILWIQVDQRNRKGVVVDFMGRLSQVAPGAALFAGRLGCPVIPAVTLRKPDSKYRVIFGRKIDLPAGSSDVKSGMEKILQPIGKYVRAYPQQWTWFHKMWKVRKEALA